MAGARSKPKGLLGGTLLIGALLGTGALSLFASPVGATRAGYTDPNPCSAAVNNGVCISNVSVSYSTTAVVMTMTVGQATDPASDPNWSENAYTQAGFLIFTGNAQVPNYSFFAADYDAYPGQLNGAVQANTGSTTCNGPSQGVVATANLNANTYSIRFPSTCIGSPTSFSIQAYYEYGSSATNQVTASSPQGSSCCTTSPTPNGYWLVGGDGGIFTFGGAQFYGSTGNLHLQRPVVGITPTADDAGYWLDASDGGVFAFGDTQFYGSVPGVGIHPAGSGLPNSLNSPVVGMVPSADGKGYFMVGADGGVFAFGDAQYEGSCPAIGACDAPAVAVMPDATGKGYWLVTAAGSIYAFGDAPYYGSPRPQSLPVTSAVRTPDGAGYWLLYQNGVVANFGDAADYDIGPMGPEFPPPAITGSSNPANAIFTTSDGGGYWVALANGAVFPYGDAPNDGGMNGRPLNASIIAAAGF